MTIDKAIEILSDSAYNGSVTFNQDFKDATKLGIEALKVIRDDREQGYFPEDFLLPGETKDLSFTL